MDTATPRTATEIAAFRKNHPEVSAIDAFLPDLCCVERGKRYPIDYLERIFDPGVALPGSTVLLDVNGTSGNPLGLGISDGDPDCHARAVPGTLKLVPWAKRPTAQVLLTLSQEGGAPYYYEPRNVAARVAARFAELGLTPVIAFELEFYLIDPKRRANGTPQPPASPLTGIRKLGTQVYSMADLDTFGGFLDDVHKACAAQGVPASAVSAEYAPAQFEVNLSHVADPLAAADHAVLLRRLVQGVARRHGMRATFMGKPFLGQAGSGMHLHMSLADGAGGNVFADGDAGGERLRHAIAGVLQTLPEAIAIYAPNPNAYRRYQPNIFVPTTKTWGFENRSTAVRVPLGGAEARRIEFRVPSADANPYLVLAALLASAHYGLANALEPPPPTTGNACTQLDPDIPFRIRPALEAMSQSTVLPDYLGERYCDVYRACKAGELERFESTITGREYDWYLLAD